MDFLRKILVQIQQQLGSLTLTNKLLVALSLVLLFVALYWLFTWSGEAEKVALLDQSLTDEQRAQIQSKLDMWAVEYEVQGDRLMVLRKDRPSLYARLQIENAMPADTSESWEKIFEETDMWTPPEERKRRARYVTEMRLAEIIENFAGVSTAAVMINEGSKRTLSGGPSSDPSASVSLTTKGSAKANRKTVEAIAKLVSGTVNRLTPERVNIVIDGEPYRVSDPESGFSDEYLVRQHEHQNRIREEIVETLSIVGLRVGVHVDLETQQVQERTHTYGDPQISEQETHKKDNMNRPAGETPGVTPNTSVAVSGARDGRIEQNSEKESKVVFGGDRDVTERVLTNMRGVPRKVSATVLVPTTYLERVWRGRNQADPDTKPTAEQLDTFAVAEFDRIRNMVQTLISSETDANDVTVDQYYDFAMADAGVERVVQEAGLNGLIARFGKPVGLGALAAFSVLMVLLMARKGPAEPSVPGLDEDAIAGMHDPRDSDTLLEGDPGAIGEADSVKGVLQAYEVDEDTVEANEMIEQLRDMVRQDPSSLSEIVRKWVAEDN